MNNKRNIGVIIPERVETCLGEVASQQIELGMHV